MKEYLISNVILVTGEWSGPGCIAVRDSYIENVFRRGEDGSAAYGGENIPFEEVPIRYAADNPDAEIMDFGGLLAFAGGIDAHVHFREPGMTHKADMASESLAAVLGGVTSFIDMPNTNPPTVSASRIADKVALARGRCRANYGFHIGATNSNCPEIEEMIHNERQRHIFGGVKVFMGSSTGNMLVDEDSALASFFKLKGKVVMVHSEDEAVIKANLARAAEEYGDDIPFSAHKDIRSRQACIRSTAKALELAMEYGTALHVLHVSTKEEVRMIRAAKAYNPHITAETSANYLWFCSEDYDRLGSHLKCNPAIKDEEDRAALREALRDGTIDTVGSDHAPHLLSEKDRKYPTAPSGLPSLRQSLPVLLTVAARENIPLTRVASVFSEKAAELFEVRDRGRLCAGYKADIVLVDPEAEFTVDNEHSGYRCGWTPYEGETLRGEVRNVFVNGVPCVRDGILTGAPPGGEGLIFG